MNIDHQYLLTHNETLYIEETIAKPDGIIAFPTDTVYGLGCLPENEQAVDKIYELKGRDRSKPLILLGSSLEKLSRYVKYIPNNLETILAKNWPGPLTVILPKSRNVPDYITSELDSIGIRVPNNPLIIEILKRCTHYNVLATTSANLSDRPNIINIEELKKELGNKIDYVLENKDYEISGTPSTVIAINKDNTIKVIRQGTVIIE